jgi:hypothetical protein
MDLFTDRTSTGTMMAKQHDDVCGSDPPSSKSDAMRRLPGLTNGSITARRYFVFAMGRRQTRAMTDCRLHGEGEHHQETVPPMPGSALVIIESELIRGLNTVSGRPSASLT